MVSGEPRPQPRHVRCPSDGPSRYLRRDVCCLLPFGVYEEENIHGGFSCAGYLVVHVFIHPHPQLHSYLHIQRHTRTRTRTRARARTRTRTRTRTPTHTYAHAHTHRLHFRKSKCPPSLGLMGLFRNTRPTFSKNPR